MEEYSKGKIHKSEPEPRNGNVNTVYFIHQARGILESDARGTERILVPRSRAPFGQHQESRPLARSNDIPVLNGFVNTIDWDQNQSDLSDLAQSMRRATGSPWIADFLDTARGLDSWCWPKGARPLGTRMDRAQKRLDMRSMSYAFTPAIPFSKWQTTNPKPTRHWQSAKTAGHAQYVSRAHRHQVPPFHFQNGGRRIKK